MGDPRGFLKSKREAAYFRPASERVKDFREVAILRPESKSCQQASRCMDCGTPFCNSGCPIGNYIPEWNDNVFNSQWDTAFKLLNETNTLPEVTGRVCPAPCEYGCVLGINDEAVTIRDNELSIIEKAFKEGYIKPNPPAIRTGKKVAVIGSGPAGLTAAALLNKAGHWVTVFEKDEKPGGIMRFGIPDFKLDKSVLDRRIKLWQAEGIEFRTSVKIGEEIKPEDISSAYDAILLAIGCGVARDMANIPGRNLKGIYQAMAYLAQSNRRISGWKFYEEDIIDAAGKNVVVIGGGDTGSDCVGTANRQGAKSVTQIEVLAKPPKQRPLDQPWPKYPFIFKTSSSHEEGVERKWSLLTKKFNEENGVLKSITCSEVDCILDPVTKKMEMKELADKTAEIPADMVVLAMGFTNPERSGLLESLGVKLDGRGNVDRNTGAETSVKGIFSAGDVSRGPSLIVWAINEGIRAAAGINKYLSLL